MADYKVTRVSENPPREWNFTNKQGATVNMETYKVMLEGVEGPVDVNKKPGNAPRVGDVLTGSITQDDYGQKFKAAPKPFTPGQASAKDQDTIRAQWAIGQSVNIEVNYAKQEDAFSFDRVEENAKVIFKMVERVKNAPDTSGYDTFKKAGERLHTSNPPQSPNTERFSDGSPAVDPFPGDVDTEVGIDLSDIPF